MNETQRQTAARVAAGVIHAADFEGSRLCGASDGLKTVFRSEGSVTCPDCIAAIAGGGGSADPEDAVEVVEVVEVEAPEWAHPRWQGHDHGWPELDQLDELDADHVVSCSDCGMPMLALDLRVELRAQAEAVGDAGD